MGFQVICVFLTVTIISVLVGGERTEEHKLISTLLKKYEKDGIKEARPVNSTSDKLNLKFGVTLTKATVNPETRRLTASVWFKYMWTDEHLRWNSADYKDLYSVRMSINKLWTPDIFLYNGFGNMEMNREALAIVYNTGVVLWIPPATIQVDCTEDGEVYYCPMKFGSWTYNGNMMGISFYEDKEEFDLEPYLADHFANTIEVVEKFANKTSKFYDCCPDEPYESIMYHLKLKGGASALTGVLSMILLMSLFQHYVTE